MVFNAVFNSISQRPVYLFMLSWSYFNQSTWILWFLIYVITFLEYCITGVQKHSVTISSLLIITDSSVRVPSGQQIRVAFKVKKNVVMKSDLNFSQALIFSCLYYVEFKQLKSKNWRMRCRSFRTYIPLSEAERRQGLGGTVIALMD